MPLSRFCIAILLALGAVPPAALSLKAQSPGPDDLVSLQRWEGDRGWSVHDSQGIQVSRGATYRVPGDKVLILTRVVAHLEACGAPIRWTLTVKPFPRLDRLWDIASRVVPTPPAPPPPATEGEHLVCDQVDLDFGLALPPGSELSCRVSGPQLRGRPTLFGLRCMGYFRPAPGVRP